MRHATPIQFPSSDTYAPSFFIFNQFPKDIGLAILEHCSPFDLIQLEKTSRFLRSFIRAHQHLWVAAQVNVSRNKCHRVPALPAVEASGNYSQTAYARRIFAGGKCSWCAKWTPLLPFNFTFRFRACSPACKALLSSDASIFVDKARKYENFSWGNWLPRVEERIANEAPFYAYSKKAIKDAERERHQSVGIDAGNSFRDPRGYPARSVQRLNQECERRARSRDVIHKNASALDKWRAAYISERESVSRANFQFLKRLSSHENKKVQGIIRCPTVARIFFAFNRDLAMITSTVWIHNKAAILAELKYMREGVTPAGMVLRPNDKMRCAYCPRLIKVKGMGDHVVDMHKGQNPDTIPSVPESTTKHCSGCPDSKRVFTTRGLADHKLNKHSNKPTIPETPP
ncbi:hypothetical protein B0H11DRAFT_1975738 [Mycena galericulata]|nr:hypothetical protein B0H11DRAFT_1975738 [Mycena galericulata]